MALPVRGEMLQHHGFVHGGVISDLVDSAITFAGGSVLGENVVTAEYKVNYLKPARGQRLVATAAVESSGSRIAVCAVRWSRSRTTGKSAAPWGRGPSRCSAE
jgi:acyl-CoA thioesterase